MTVRLPARLSAPIEALPSLPGRRAVPTALCLCATLLSAAPELASAGEIPYGSGLLWQIERPGQEPSYVFGTIHLGGERILNLPRPVREAFSAARSACFELLVDHRALRQAESPAPIASGRTLDEVLGPDLYAEVVQAARPYGIDERELRHMEPRTFLMILRRSTSDERIADDNIPLDLWLQQEAERRGKRLCALETIEEQLAVFDDLPDELHQALMRAMIDAESQTPPPAGTANHLDETVELYLAGHVGQLLEISRTGSSPAEQQLVDLLIDRMLNRRNRVMVRRMGPRLAEGRAFIAVGAAHLPGKDGILNLLAQQGYAITRLY